MDNFLSKLKINPAASFSTERYTGQDIFLKLDTTGDDTFLCVVNGKGEDITPDYRYYAGSVAQLLRLILTCCFHSLYARTSWTKT